MNVTALMRFCGRCFLVATTGVETELEEGAEMLSILISNIISPP